MSRVAYNLIVETAKTPIQIECIARDGSLLEGRIVAADSLNLRVEMDYPFPGFRIDHNQAAFVLAFAGQGAAFADADRISERGWNVARNMLLAIAEKGWIFFHDRQHYVALHAQILRNLNRLDGGYERLYETGLFKRLKTDARTKFKSGMLGQREYQGIMKRVARHRAHSERRLFNLRVGLEEKLRPLSLSDVVQFTRVAGKQE